MARIIFLPHEGRGLGHLSRACTFAKSLNRDGHHCLIFTGDSRISDFSNKELEYVKVLSLDGVSGARAKFLGTTPYLNADERDVNLNRRKMFNTVCELFQPDVFISDQLPLGTRGEAIDFIRNQNALKYYIVRSVIGQENVAIHDVLRFDAKNALETNFDRILVAADERTSSSHIELSKFAKVKPIIKHIGYAPFNAFTEKKEDIRMENHVPANSPWAVCSFGSGFDSEDSVFGCIDAAKNNSNIMFDIVCGPRAYGKVIASGNLAGENVRIHKFIPNLYKLHHAADISIVHGGKNLIEALSGKSQVIVCKREDRSNPDDIERLKHAAEIAKIEEISFADTRPQIAELVTQLMAKKKTIDRQINIGGVKELSRIIKLDLANKNP